MIGLEFVLRLDASFTPAVNLQQQLSSGAQEIDLSEIISQLQAPTAEDVDELLVEAVEEFNQRNFLEAKDKVEKVLVELPGHQEARQLLGQISDALKVENQVGQFLAQAREALDGGDPQEAANFVMMAQALDPHHSGIAPTLQEIYDRGGGPRQQAEPAAAAPDAVAFETSESTDDLVAVDFEEIAEDEPEPLVEPASSTTEFVPPGEDASASGLGAEDEEPWQSDAQAPLPETDSDEPQQGLESAADELFGDRQPPTPVAAGPAPSQPADADDISDLFEAEPETTPLVAEDAAPASAGSHADLLRRGEAALESGDHMAAIDAWSRIYLIDPADSTVGPRIEEARQRLDDVERRVEHMLFEAQDASLSGEVDKARKLVDEILALQPHHIQALELSKRLTVPGADDTDAAEMPELEEDLFEDRATAPAAESADEIALEWAESEARRILGLPVRTAAIIGGGGVVLAIVLWLVLGVFSGSQPTGGDVYEVRAQAEELYRQGKPREALRLVQSYQTTDPAEQQVVSHLITKYQRTLATPTPTPIPVYLTRARQLKEQGYWFHAYAEAMRGLRANHDDYSLLETKDEIEDQEAMVSVLHSALVNGNFQSAVGIANDLLELYPQQADLVEVLERSLFNASLAELRAYNLTGAEGYLRDLDLRHPDDEVVDRILEFIAKYKARPVDMQLQVFIGSIDERRRRELPLADSRATTTPVPVPDTSPTPIAPQATAPA
jgi:tetratricopeptide (TPR) repeat protein